MALKAGCCVLGFPSGPAEHLNRMEDSGLVGLIVPTCLLVLSSMRSQIYDYSTIRSIIMMHLKLWLHKYQYGVDSHQATVLVQLGIFTCVSVKMRAAS
ncbi:Chloroplast envelope membrane protein [Trichinella pseudospiralis]